MNSNISTESMWKTQAGLQSSDHIKTVIGKSCDAVDIDPKSFIRINAAGMDLFDTGINSGPFESTKTDVVGRPCRVSDLKGYTGLDPAAAVAFGEAVYVTNSFNHHMSNSNDPSLPKESKSYINQSCYDPGILMKMLQQSEPCDPSLKMGSNSSAVRPNTTQIHAVSEEEFLWYYLDPRNNMQGPFHDSQMFQWWSQGIYFQNSLLMKRKCDADFSTLQDYSKRFNGVPFSRKDIRVPPLTESLSGGYLRPSSGVYSSGGDAGILLQLLSSGGGGTGVVGGGSGNSAGQHVKSPPEELTKLLRKMNVQGGTTAGLTNGTDLYSVVQPPSSLSNYAMKQNSFQQQPSPPMYMADNKVTMTSSSGASVSKVGDHRFASRSWEIPQSSGSTQGLVDSVWTSSGGSVWSSTAAAAAVSPSNTILSSMLQPGSRRQPQQHHHQHVHLHHMHQQQCNPLQDTWDSLDPAIIKVVPPGNQSTSEQQHIKPLSSSLSTTVNDDSNDHQVSSQRPSTSVRSHSESAKQQQQHPWADLVRKSSSSNGQRCKSGRSSEMETITNHSTSPNNQTKLSVTSNSSDENDQHQISDGCDKELDCLIKWSKAFLESKPAFKDVDIETLIELLITVESPYEVEAMLRENVPDFDSSSEFLKVFLEKRRPVRQRLLNDDGQKKMQQTQTQHHAGGKVVPHQPQQSSKNGDVTTTAINNSIGNTTVTTNNTITSTNSNKWQVRSKNPGGSTKRKRKNNNNK